MTGESSGISVCMATYNGAAYITQQLESILSQLPANAEVVIVDDCSSDNTVDLVEAFGDERITVHVQPANGGYVKAFERALTLARGDLLFLSDHDDVWLPGRVAAMAAVLSDHAVVASDVGLLPDGRSMSHPITGRPWLLPKTPRHPRRTVARILVGTGLYYGCAMALRRDFLSIVLPFPEFVSESHDQWITLCALAARQLAHLQQQTVWRRIHGANASSGKPRALRAMLKTRWALVREVAEARQRIKASG